MLPVPVYKYIVAKSCEVSFDLAVKEVLSAVDVELAVRITLFADVDSAEEYQSKLAIVGSSVAERFGDKMPAYSLVSQATFGCEVAAEACLLSSKEFEIERRPYGVVVRGEEYEEIVAGGLVGNCVEQSFSEQCITVFEKLGAILDENGCGVERIVRQWNYIEHITHMSEGEQNYQIFNDARSKFYAKGDWSVAGYPSATGIGATAGGVVIDFNALVRCGEASFVALDNPLQIAAHVYSECVLLGDAEVKTTPKFERAKAVCAEGVVPMIYVSGTAAIRGEASLESGAAEQTVITMENIAYLISKENQRRYGVVGDRADMACGNLRVYIKNKEDFDQIRAEVERLAPGVPTIYLFGDVCRDELLVEIEGVALSHIC